MYLEHFKLKELPFSLTPNPDFFCELPNHQAALNVLLVCLKNGEGFLKVVGEVGAGKTLICRLLMDHLDDNYYTAYIPNPDLNPDDLRKALAKELDVSFEPQLDTHSLLDKINSRLLELHQQNKPVVLLIDEAQCLSDASLETVRLLTNLETASKKLLQVVLFGQPELNSKLKQNNLRQLAQRITFAYDLPPISKQDVSAYINCRLAQAGYASQELFSKPAQHYLYKYSGGLPRLINILCHKALIVAYGRGEKQISKRAMLSAIADTESTLKPSSSRSIFSLGLLAVVGLGMLAIVKFSGLHL